jgi:hypothetical protein
LNLLAGVVNVETDQIAFGIVIEHDPFGNLAALRACFLAKIDIEGVGLRIIV